MERFHGHLRDGDRILFHQVTGFLEFQEGRGPAAASGRFEIHEGGVLASALATDRPYCLELDDGRAGTIDVTKVQASNSAGIARVEFRLASGLVVSAERPSRP